MEFMKAVKIYKECDGTDCDCEKCPIGKKVEQEAHAAGVYISGTACSVFGMLNEMLENLPDVRPNPGNMHIDSSMPD